jgi:hypothetical protein
MSARLASAAFLAAMTVAVNAAKAEVDESVRIANNFSQENIVCGAYYSLVSQCLAKDDPKDELVKQYIRASLTFIQRAIKAGGGKTVSVEIAKRDMMSEIENNCINIVVLLEKHAQRCKRLFEVGPKSFAEEMSRSGAKTLKPKSR